MLVYRFRSIGYRINTDWLEEIVVDRSVVVHGLSIRIYGTHIGFGLPHFQDYQQLPLHLARQMG